MLNMQNRILPNLIDKLTDNAPGERLEPLKNREVSIEKYQDIVLRDLIGLLNSSVTLREDDLEIPKGIDAFTDHVAGAGQSGKIRSRGTDCLKCNLEYVKKSTLAYGMRSFAGMSLSNSSVEIILDEIKQAILKFEGRIDPNSLKVNLTKNADGSVECTTNHKLKISITGILRPLQKAETILITTEIDLETGKFELVA